MKKYLILFLMILLVLGLGINVQAQILNEWQELHFEEDPFTGEVELIIGRPAEDMVHMIGIRNLFEPIDIIILTIGARTPAEFATGRYKFDDEETRTANWAYAEEHEFYYFMGDSETVNYNTSDEDYYDHLRDFVRKMMEHDTDPTP